MRFGKSPGSCYKHQLTLRSQLCMKQVCGWQHNMEMHRGYTNQAVGSQNITAHKDAKDISGVLEWCRSLLREGTDAANWPLPAYFSYTTRLGTQGTGHGAVDHCDHFTGGPPSAHVASKQLLPGVHGTGTPHQQTHLWDHLDKTTSKPALQRTATGTCAIEGVTYTQWGFQEAYFMAKTLFQGPLGRPRRSHKILISIPRRYGNNQKLGYHTFIICFWCEKLW